MKAIRSRPDTKEAEVLKELSKCRNQVMLAKTQEFLSEFKEQGFGFVEGSKWSSYTTREQFTQEDSYMTPEQISTAKIVEMIVMIVFLVYECSSSRCRS